MPQLRDRDELAGRRAATAVWRLAGLFVLLAIGAALHCRRIGPDLLDHLGNARWLCGSPAAMFIDHRPPTLTALLWPLAFAHRLGALEAEQVLSAMRVGSCLALAAAAWATARALPAPIGPLARAGAALSLAASPLLLALAPAGSHDVVASAGVALLLWLYARWHGGAPGATAGRAVLLGLAGAGVGLIRFDTCACVAGILGAEALAAGAWRRALLAGGATLVGAVGLVVGQSALRHGWADALPELARTFHHARGAVEAPRPGSPRGPGAIYAASLLLAVGPGALLCAAVGAGRALRRREPVLVAAGLGLVLALFELSLVRNAEPRYLAQHLPALALLSAAGVHRLGAGRPRRLWLALAACAVWPVVAGPRELATFLDPACTRPSGERLADACRAALPPGARPWLVGGNYLIRPAREHFVYGDSSTRTWPIGLGELSFRLGRPVYWHPGPPERAFLAMAPGDVALLVEVVDYREWPLRRSGPAGLVRLERRVIPLEGEPWRDGSLQARRAGSRLLLSALDPRAAGEWSVVAVGGGSPPRALGLVALAAGAEQELPWPDPAPGALHLLGGPRSEIEDP